MNSRWSGDAENAFYSGEKFDRSRVLYTAENEYTVTRNRVKETHYILGVDVGRIGLEGSSIKIFLIAGKPKYESIWQSAAKILCLLFLDKG